MATKTTSPRTFSYHATLDTMSTTNDSLAAEEHHGYLFSDNDDAVVPCEEMLPDGEFAEDGEASNNDVVVPDSGGEDNDMVMDDAMLYEQPDMPTNTHLLGKSGFLGKSALESSGDSVMMPLGTDVSPVVVGLPPRNGDTVRSYTATELDTSPKSRISFDADKLKKTLEDRSSSKASTNASKRKSDSSRDTEVSTIPPDITTKSDPLFPSTQVYVAEMLAEAGQPKRRAKPAQRKPTSADPAPKDRKAEALQSLSRSGSRIFPQDPSLVPVAKKQKTAVRPSSGDEMALIAKSATLPARTKSSVVSNVIELTSSPAAQPSAKVPPDTGSSDRILRDVRKAQAKESDDDDDYDASGKNAVDNRWNKKPKKTKTTAKPAKAAAKSAATAAKSRTAKKKAAEQAADAEVTLPSSSRASRASAVASTSSSARNLPVPTTEREMADLPPASESSCMEVSNGPGARVLSRSKAPTDKSKKRAKTEGIKGKLPTSAEFVESDADDEDNTVVTRKEAAAVNTVAELRAATTSASRAGSSKEVGVEDRANDFSADANEPQRQPRAGMRAAHIVETSSDAEEQQDAKRRESESTTSQRQDPAQIDAPEPSTSRDSRKRKAPEIVVEIQAKRTSAPPSSSSTTRQHEEITAAASLQVAIDTEQPSSEAVGPRKKAAKAKKPNSRTIPQSDDEPSASEAEEVSDTGAEPETLQKTKKKDKEKSSKSKEKKSETTKSKKSAQAPAAPHSPQKTESEIVAPAVLAPKRSPAKVSGAIQPPAKAAPSQPKGLLAVVGKYGGGLGVKTQGISRKGKVPSLLKFMGPMPAKRPPIPLEKKKPKKGEEIYSDEDQEEKNDQPEEWWEPEDFFAWEVRKKKRAKAKGMLDDYVPGHSTSRDHQISPEGAVEAGSDS